MPSSVVTCPDSLKKLQTDFWNMVRTPQAEHTNFVNRLTPSAQKDNRHNIYQKTVKRAHIDALRSRFPCCEALLGRTFTGIANYYYLQEPATSSNLNHYGDDFIDYLKQYPEIQNDRDLISLARCELAIEKNYFSEDYPPLDANKLTQFGEDLGAVKCRLHPELVTVHLSEAHLNLIRDKHPYLAIDEQIASDWYVVHVVEGRVVLSAQSTACIKALRMAAHAIPLQTVLNRVPEMTRLFPTWLQHHWVIDLYTDDV